MNRVRMYGRLRKPVLTISKSDLSRLTKLCRNYIGETTNKDVLYRHDSIRQFLDGLDKKLHDYEKKIEKAIYDASPEGRSARYEQGVKVRREHERLLLEKKIERAKQIVANEGGLRKSLEKSFEEEDLDEDSDEESDESWES